MGKGDVLYLSEKATKEFDRGCDKKAKFDFLLALRTDGSVDVYVRNDKGQGKLMDVAEIDMSTDDVKKTLYDEHKEDYQKAGVSRKPKPDQDARIKLLSEGRIFKTTDSISFGQLEPVESHFSCGWVYHSGRCWFTP